jgi:hypothetical protein
MPRVHNGNGMGAKVRLLANIVVNRVWHPAGSVVDEDLIPEHLRCPEFVSRELVDPEADSFAAAYNAVTKEGEPVVHSSRRVIPPGGSGPKRPGAYGAHPDKLARRYRRTSE